MGEGKGVMAEIPVGERDRVQTCPFVLQPIINNTGHVTQICLIRCITSFLRLSKYIHIYLYLFFDACAVCVFLYSIISNEIRANKFVCVTAMVRVGRSEIYLRAKSYKI